MSDRIIMLNRGDTLLYTYRLSEHFDNGDAIYFGITLPQQPFEEALFRQKYTEVIEQEGIQYAKISVPSVKTQLLPPATYYYSIKLKKADGTVITLQNKTKLIIIE